MTLAEYEALVAHRAGLTYEGRKELKAAEIERLAYDGKDPLDIMIYLQGLKLLWY